MGTSAYESNARISVRAPHNNCMRRGYSRVAYRLDMLKLDPLHIAAVVAAAGTAAEPTAETAAEPTAETVAVADPDPLCCKFI